MVRRRGATVFLTAEVGPDNRCTPELGLFESNIPDPTREFEEIEIGATGESLEISGLPSRRPADRQFPDRPPPRSRREPAEIVRAAESLDPWAT